VPSENPPRRIGWHGLLVNVVQLEGELERLADIAGAEPEERHIRPAAYQTPIEGNLEVRGPCFRYAEGEPFVLRDVNLSVRAGDYVAITGPSGCGKTTLLKLIMGLLEPAAGEILIDGVPLRVLGHDAFRKSIGVVMQDDQLLSGSIADNICFFDESFDLDHMTYCARLAGIHDEICLMPMAYKSLIDDMGTSLSGGQNQRVLLARALYRRPRLLFMDEGTSHLDVATERQVTAAIKSLGLTRIIIAHRPETIASALRRLTSQNGGNCATCRRACSRPEGERRGEFLSRQWSLRPQLPAHYLRRSTRPEERRALGQCQYCSLNSGRAGGGLWWVIMRGRPSRPPICSARCDGPQGGGLAQAAIDRDAASRGTVAQSSKRGSHTSGAVKQVERLVVGSRGRSRRGSIRAP
jgi:ABC-type multidrug transport system ATPase subunit